MTRLRVVNATDTLRIYPLPLEASLDGFRYWRFQSARLLTPELKAKTPIELRGACLNLWTYAMDDAAPAGTLPSLDEALAVICEFQHDVRRFTQIRYVLLDGWSPVTCRSEDGKTEETRLAHPYFEAMALESWHARDKSVMRGGGKTQSTRRARVADHLRKRGMGQLAINPKILDAILSRLDALGQQIRSDEVLAAGEFVSMTMDAQVRTPEDN